jgi:hypothetical protein
MKICRALVLLTSVWGFCAASVASVELTLLDESRQACDSLRQGKGFLELRSDPMWKDLRFHYQLNDQTGNCEFSGFELHLDSWQRALMDNLLQGLSVHYGSRFSPDFWNLTNWVQEEQPQNRIQVFRNQEFSFSIIPDVQGYPSVLLQFTTLPGEFLDR